MIEWGLVAGLALGLSVLAVTPWLPSVFTQDDAVRGLAVFLLLLTAAVQPVNGIVFSLDGILIGAGDLRYLAWAMLAASAVLVSSGVAVLALDAGIGWLWAGLLAWMLTRLVLLSWRFSGGRWLVTGAER
jgi:Na+-driven multidrug efflux pump